MGRERRQRNIRHLITNQGAPKPVEWASPTQEAFFNYGPQPALASGGYGAGKTLAACRKAVYLSDIYPNNRGVIYRQTWDHLKNTTLPTLLKTLPPAAYRHGGRFAPSEKLIQLNPRVIPCEECAVAHSAGKARRCASCAEVPGSQILLMHLDDPESAHVIKGLEVNWLIGDQAEDTDEEMFDKMLSRLGRWDQAVVPQQLIEMEKAQGREWPWWNTEDGKYAVGARPMPPTYAMLTCNPDHLYHWLYRRFHTDSPDHWEKKIPDPSAPESGRLVSYHDLGYKLFDFPSLDNKFLPKQQRVALLSGDESFKRRYVYGVWGLPEGQIHDVPKSAEIEGSKEILDWIRYSCKLHRSMDHGDSAPTACVWWGTDREGNIFAYREYYQAGKLVSEHRKAITNLSYGETYVFNVADPSIFGQGVQKEGKRWFVVDEWRDVRALPRETAIFWTKGERDELGTRDRISELLRPLGSGEVDENGKEKPRPHPITRELGFWPRLFFVKRNANYTHGIDNALRETRAQVREKVGSVNGKPTFSEDRDESIPDHAYDCVRYFVASRPPSAIAPPMRRGKVFEDWMREKKDFEARGGYRIAQAQMKRRERFNVA